MPSPNATWVQQVCRNLTDTEDGFLKDASHLIVNRDTSVIAVREFIKKNTEAEVVRGMLVSQSEVRVHGPHGSHAVGNSTA
ncbi:MAG: hypothetical protein P8K08_06060 [Fuerstiella sp.]|jgi:hypothetical protein|nr:hypothetical protein [Fuerstiella sp.]